MKYFLNSIKMFAVLSVLCGIIYPLLATVFAQAVFADKAHGSVISINGQNIGSELLAQKFISPKYFWARPSACDWQTIPSGASNLSVFDAKIQNNIRMYKEQYGNESGTEGDEMLFASASGLDTHISPRNALAQAVRVSKARGIGIGPLTMLVNEYTENRTFGFLGEERVSVLKLNLALDNYEK